MLGILDKPFLPKLRFPESKSQRLIEFVLMGEP